LKSFTAIICNRGLRKAGVQLEITRGPRDALLVRPQGLLEFSHYQCRTQCNATNDVNGCRATRVLGRKLSTCARLAWLA
jgi:hypothetical protein